MSSRNLVAGSDPPVILDPVIQRFLDKLRTEGAAPIQTLTPAHARASLVDLQRAPISTLCFLKSTTKNLTIENEGYAVRLRIVRPIGASPKRPAVVYFHGGGWVLGDETTHDRLVRELAVGADAVVIFVEYGLAPEHRYPTQLEQCYSAVCYVADNPNLFEIDTTRVTVAGDSAGGNIAAAICLIAKERRRPLISSQLLFYPVTSSCLDSESFEQFENGPWLTKAAMKWFWDQYVPNLDWRNDLTASPLLATNEDLKGLPRTLLITSENDILRDQGEAYGRKLLRAGVEVVTTRYVGTIHDFLMLNALAESAATRAAIAQAVQFLTDAFPQETK